MNINNTRRQAVNIVVDTNIMSFSYGDDWRLFGPQLTITILCIKRNDPTVTDLYLNENDYLCERAWRRLGDIVGESEHLKVLSISRSDVNLGEFCTGLRNNTSIQILYFDHIRFRDAGRMFSLAPVLSRHPGLRKIILQHCDICTDSIKFLSAGLLIRGENTLEELNIWGNKFSDVDLDILVQALSKRRTLNLGECCIGRRGCTSLAMLLRNPELNLSKLMLGQNSIDDECTDILASSLSNNTKLQTLCLCEKNGITALGWRSILSLVYNSTSTTGVMESNHTLSCLNIPCSERVEDSLVKALGFYGANLLCTSLTMNANDDKMVVVRRKMLWSHVRGNLNLGDSIIETAAMPLILVWIGKWTDESNAHHMQCQDLPLRMAMTDTTRLDSFYRLVRSRPGLCNANENTLGGYQGKQVHFHTNGKRKAGENKYLHGICSRPKLCHVYGH